METNIAIFRGKERFIRFLRTFRFKKRLYWQHMTLAFTSMHPRCIAKSKHYRRKGAM